MLTHYLRKGTFADALEPCKAGIRTDTDTCEHNNCANLVINYGQVPPRQDCIPPEEPDYCGGVSIPAGCSAASASIGGQSSAYTQFNYHAQQIIDNKSGGRNYWASGQKHVSNEFIYFDMGSSKYPCEIEWTDRGGSMGVKSFKLAVCAEAPKCDCTEGRTAAHNQKNLVCSCTDSCEEVSTWGAQKTSDWQGHKFEPEKQGRFWKLTFVENWGARYHFVVQEVRLFAAGAGSSLVETTHEEATSFEESDTTAE